MRLIRTLRGVGTLDLPESKETVTYEVHHWLGRQGQWADGTFRGQADTLRRAVGEEFVFILSNGFKTALVLTRYTYGAEWASGSLSGPLPSLE